MSKAQTKGVMERFEDLKSRVKEARENGVSRLDEVSESVAIYTAQLTDTFIKMLLVKTLLMRVEEEAAKAKGEEYDKEATMERILRIIEQFAYVVDDAVSAVLEEVLKEESVPEERKKELVRIVTNQFTEMNKTTQRAMDDAGIREILSQIVGRR